MVSPSQPTAGRSLPPGPASAREFEVDRLAETDLPAVSALTFPSYRPLLADAGESQPGIIALVARVRGRPVGLLMAKPPVGAFEDAPRSPGSLQLLSLATAADYRRRGVASRLLQALTETASVLGCARLTVDYTTKLRGFLAWESLLGAAGWQAPQPTLRMALSRMDVLAAAPWVRAPRWDSLHCEVFSWNKLTRAERRCLEQELAAGVIPEVLSPFADEAFLVPDMSIGVRLKGQIVAWMIVTRAPLVPDALCCRSLFVLPHLRQGRGFGPFLIAESLRRYASSAVRAERSTAIYAIPFATQKQINFFRKRLEAYCFETYESRSAERLL